MARKIIGALDGNVAGKTVALLGLTFKPNTDDMRESPSIPIVFSLQDKGAHVRAYDPQGMEEARKFLTNVDYRASAYDCLEGADVAVIVTEWDEFRALDLERVKKLLRQPVIVDLRNIYRLDDMARHGFRYESIGRAGTAP
jgi:UDPglucose 6-dehydrogenase